MPRRPKHQVVLVTAPDPKTSVRIARGALKLRLAACVNLLGPLDSHYWWQGKIDRSREILLIFKTTRQALPALERFVAQTHPYDTPEFLVLPIVAGARRYLDWIGENVEPKPSAREGERKRRKSDEL